MGGNRWEWMGVHGHGSGWEWMGEVGVSGIR